MPAAPFYNTGQIFLDAPYRVNQSTPSFTLVYDKTQSTTLKDGITQTGVWRPLYPSDFGSTNVSISGGISVGNVAVTGGQIAIIGTPPVTVANAVLPVSGNVNANVTNSLLATSGVATILSLPTQNVAVTGGSILTIVTGTIGGNVTVNSVAVTGAPVFTLTGVTPVTVVNAAASSSSVALTGFSPNLPPLPVSGALTASIAAVAITGNPIVTITGVVATSTSVTVGAVAITGFNATIAPLAVSGAFSTTIGNVAVTGGSIQVITTGAAATVTIGALAITGFNSTIAPLAVSGNLSVAAAPIQAVSGFAINQGGYVGVTGSPVFTITGVLATTASVVVGSVAVTGGQILAVSTGVQAVNIVSSITQGITNLGGFVGITGFTSTIAPLAVSGSFAATIGNIAVTGGNINVYNATELSLLSGIQTGLLGISGQLAQNLNGVAPISGLVGITNTAPLAISGFVNTIVTGGSVNASITNPLGVTGVNRDTNANFNNGTLYTFLPIGGRASAATGAASATGYTSGQYAMLNLNQTNGGLFVNQANLDYTQDTVSVSSSGVFAVSVTGAPVFTITGVLPTSTSVTIGNVAVTGGSIQVITTGSAASVTIGALAITGFNSTIAPLPVSGFLVNQGGFTAITGTVAVNNLGGFIGVTGTINANVVSSAVQPVYNSGGLVGITGIPTVNIVSSITQATYVSGGLIGITGDQRTVVLSGGYTAITGFTSTIAPLAVSGVFSSVNPVGVTGVAKDLNPTFTGIASYNFLPIGGRVVDPTGVGSITGYNNTGDFAILNISRQNGGVYVSQGNLSPVQDIVSVVQSGALALVSSGVSGLAGPAFGGTIMAANPNRLGWTLQNVGTGVLLANLSATGPTTGAFSFLLKGASTPYAGDGAIWTDIPAVWKGACAVTGFGGAPVVYTFTQF